MMATDMRGGLSVGTINMLAGLHHDFKNLQREENGEFSGNK